MNPVELIKKDLGADNWKRASRAWAESSIIELDEDHAIFSNYKIYRVRGDTDQFDFPMLPHCSYGFYAANGREAIRLSRAKKEIQKILACEWPSFAKANPVHLASLILRFYDGGIQASHSVLADAQSLRTMCQSTPERQLDDGMFAKALPEIGMTSCTVEGKLVVVRAITLLGWMHIKNNLGIEVLSISEDGSVMLSPRRVLSLKVFNKLPEIRY